VSTDLPGRLLRLLSLLQTRRTWPGAELATRLGVTDRTLRRDVERLRGLDYPVQATTGIGGGYRLTSGHNLPPLLLDDDEALATAIALATAAAGAAGTEDAALRALTTLQRVLPARLRPQLTALTGTTAAVTPRGAAPVDPGELGVIAACCRDSEILAFDYRSRSDETTVRRVEPHHLVAHGGRWYLVAFDPERADWRTFRVDRIEPQLTTGRRFMPREPPAEDIAAYVARAVSAARDRYQARIVLRAPLDEVKGRVPPTVGTLEPIDERSCLLRTGSDWLGGLAVYIAEIGVDFEVLDPPELVDRVRELAQRFARATS
jgi:predicted DNA-binding transcriptional regulator YafY